MKTMKKLVTLLFLGAFLFSVTPAVSQTGQDNSGTSTENRDRDDDDDTDWGWIGLLGLAGLLGLRGRDRDNRRDNDAGRVNR